MRRRQPPDGHCPRRRCARGTSCLLEGLAFGVPLCSPRRTSARAAPSAATSLPGGVSRAPPLRRSPRRSGTARRQQTKKQASLPGRAGNLAGWQARGRTGAGARDNGRARGAVRRAIAVRPPHALGGARTVCTAGQTHVWHFFLGSLRSAFCEASVSRRPREPAPVRTARRGIRRRHGPRRGRPLRPARRRERHAEARAAGRRPNRPPVSVSRTQPLACAVRAGAERRFSKADMSPCDAAVCALRAGCACRSGARARPSYLSASALRSGAEGAARKASARRSAAASRSRAASRSDAASSRAARSAAGVGLPRGAAESICKRRPNEQSNRARALRARRSAPPPPLRAACVPPTADRFHPPLAPGPARGRARGNARAVRLLHRK